MAQVKIKRLELIDRIKKDVFNCTDSTTQKDINCFECIFMVYGQVTICGGLNTHFNYDKIKQYLLKSKRVNITINDLKPFFIGNFNFNNYKHLKQIVNPIEAKLETVNGYDLIDKLSTDVTIETKVYTEMDLKLIVGSVANDIMDWVNESLNTTPNKPKPIKPDIFKLIEKYKKEFI